MNAATQAVDETDHRADPATSERWWEQPRFMVAIALLSAVPLFWPETPPLVDVPGHIGRYRVELDLGLSPDLQRYFEFRWALIGNLGVDLLILPLAPFIGLEPAVKLVVLLIPPLTVLGIFAVAREVHGRVPPTALFAVPFAYGYPFSFGFINFALSMALALLAFAYWLRLTRYGRFRFRAAVFVPLSCALWVMHAFGWGVLGLLAFSAELVRIRDGGESWPRSAVRAALQVVPLCVPLLLMVVWSSGGAGESRDFFNIPAKIFALVAALRDRWLLWDSLSVAAVVVLIGAAAFEKQLEFSRRLAIPATILLVVFLALPFMMMGSAYADMRLAPFMLITAILAVRFSASASADAMRRVAWLGLAFVLLRFAGTTVSYVMAERDMRQHLRALDFIPSGATVLSLVGEDCGGVWEMPRHRHLGSFTIIRRRGFSNDQWQIAGAQLLRVNYSPSGAFADDPSQMVFSRDCLEKLRRQFRPDARVGRTADEALAEFPRDAFEYVWMVRPADFALTARPGLMPVWRGRDSILYRVEKGGPNTAPAS